MSPVVRFALISALALAAAACVEEPVYRPSPPPPRVVRPAPSPRPPANPATSSSQTQPPAAPVPLPGPASPYERDGAPLPHEIPADIDKIPDAVVQAEPRSASGNPDSYEALGQRYNVIDDPHGFHERGYASWYGKKFHGRRTSSGEAYDMFKMTGAHKTLPIPCYVRVTNLENGRSVVVRINDRGPFHAGRVVDLSYSAAAKLDMLGHGSTFVELEALSPDDPKQTVPAVVSAPEPPPVVASVPPPRTLPGGEPHYLQAGVFGDVTNAAVFRDKLANFGFHPLTLHSEQREGHWLYRVLVGPFANAAELDAMRGRMNAAQQRTIPVAE